MPLDPQQAAMRDAARAAGVPQIPDVAVTELRSRIATGRKAVPAGPPMHEVTDIVVGPSGSPVTVRKYTPTASEPEATVLYLHSGGWVVGDLDGNDAEVRHLAARTGYEYVSVDYCLAPEHPFPAALDDAITALRWAADLARPLVVHGDSAGGNLAAAAAHFARDNEIELALQVLVYPVVDADFGRASYRQHADDALVSAREMAWFWDQYVPSVELRRDPRVALLEADLHGVAPTYLVVAEYDVLRDEALAYGAALRDAGNDVSVSVWPDCTHGFIGLPGLLRQADMCIADVADATRRAVARVHTTSEE